MIPKKNIIDTYHGTAIEDPHRYMENLEDTAVIGWLQRESSKTTNILHSIVGRDTIINRQIRLDERKSAKIRDITILKNDMHFYLKSEVNDNVAKLYFREHRNAKEVVIYDPQHYSSQQKDASYLISYFKPDWDGDQVAIALTKNGEEISEILIIDVKSKAISHGPLYNNWPNALGGIHWLPDNSGITYVHIPNIDPKSELFLLNTKTVLYELDGEHDGLKTLFSKEKNKQIDISNADFPMVYLDERDHQYIFGELGGASKFYDAFYAPVKDIGRDDFTWQQLFSKNEKISVYTVQEDTLFYLTAKDASNFEIRSTTITNPNFEHYEVVVPEFKDEVIKDFVMLNNSLFFATMKNGVAASLYKVEQGGIKKVVLPGDFGSIQMISQGNYRKDFWVKAKGWITPERRYRIDTETLEIMEDNLVPLIQYPEYDDLVVEEITVTSHDGLQIPLSLVYAKDLKRNGKNPVLLRGYGSYGYSMSPYFSSRILMWVAEGGIFATSHVRGGGEKGDSWHKGGFKTTKPNTWKDLISCTQYLIDQKYTTSQKTAIWSGSAGGILIGRALTERPDLFAAAAVEAGAFNMIRSEIQPNGANNVKEFGTVNNEEEFKALLEMDAYHKVKKDQKYPATLITAGMNDPRVVAWDPAKFAAKLQAANTSKNPVLLSIDFEGGHGLDQSKNKGFENFANVLSFLFWQTGHPDYQPKE